MESGGESKGGDRKAGGSVSNFCIWAEGVESLEDGMMVVTGRVFSERILG